MPPKVRFTREEIIRAALDIIRESGPEALTARSLAARLDCSAKPIFGLFRSMDEVQQEVLKAGYQFYGEAIARAMESGEYPPYKASGMAYIDFARREKHLFRLLFMRDRSREVRSQSSRSMPTSMASRQHRRAVSYTRSNWAVSRQITARPLFSSSWSLHCRYSSMEACSLGEMWSSLKFRNTPMSKCSP